jgi:hypothetical protein
VNNITDDDNNLIIDRNQEFQPEKNKLQTDLHERQRPGKFPLTFLISILL